MNVYKIDDVECKICGYETNNHQSFNSHIVHKHHINSKEYYDKYIKPNDGKCKTCGKQTAFLDMWTGYRTFCCNSCMSSNKDIQEKRKKTSMIHYDVEFPHQSEEVKQNMQQTVLNKYGTTNIFASDYCKEKIKNTMIERYGVENAAQYRDCRLKIYRTKDKLGSRSSLETMLEQFFINNNIKYEIEYNLDSRYPYFCDFYLPETDTFIEINGHWTHGFHWFDKNNIDDVNKLNKWKKYSNNSQYINAINTWTNIDLIKRQTAINNNLNYIVLWNKQDINNFINNFNKHSK